MLSLHMLIHPQISLCTTYWHLRIFEDCSKCEDFIKTNVYVDILECHHGCLEHLICLQL